ncbi:J domain-containing protein [Streptococcus ovis]|uniref:J domain-containing protein n=1 Tax=Streptococcus ovis TaxID=82806 RepID=UPI00035F9078|nr:hypothetical protein [Streptococcus ovis]
MQTIWEILGIEWTDDLKRIKKAYAEKIKTVHPEENPEGFKALQTAYRDAIALSKNKQLKRSYQSSSFEQIVDNPFEKVDNESLTNPISEATDFEHEFDDMSDEELSQRDPEISVEDIANPFETFHDEEPLVEPIETKETTDSEDLEQEKVFEFGIAFEELEEGELFVKDFKDQMGWIFTFEKVLKQLHGQHVESFFAFEHIRQEMEDYLLNTYMVGEWEDRIALVARCQQLGMTTLAEYVKLVGFTSFEHQKGRRTVLEGWKEI